MAIPGRSDRQKALDASINKNGAEMRKVLLSARDRIELQILNAVKTGNPASAAWLRDNLYKNLQKEYAKLQGDLVGWTRDATTSIAQEWTKYAVNDIKGLNYEKAWSIFSKEHLNQTIAQFSPATMAGRAAVNAGFLDPALGGMLKEDIDTLRRVVQDTTRLQAATGMTAQEWRRTVQDQVLQERGAWTFIDRAGKTWSANNYFNMLNRTIAGNASRETYLTQMADAGHDLATIEGGIPPNCCANCLAWAGKIVSVSGASDKYPSLDQAKSEGVFHPRCRHYLAVMLPGEEADAAAEEARQRKWAADNGFPLTKKKIQPGDVSPTPAAPLETEAPKKNEVLGPLGWVEHKTVQEAQDWAQKTFTKPDALGNAPLANPTAKVDYSGLSIGSANEVNRTLAQLRADGYTAPRLLRIGGNTADSGPYASASVVSLNLNRKYFGPGCEKVFEAAMKSDMRIGFHPYNCDNLKAIIDHEFAHVISIDQVRKKDGGWLPAGPLRKEALRLRTDYETQCREIKDKYGVMDIYGNHDGKKGEKVSRVPRFEPHIEGSLFESDLAKLSGLPTTPDWRGNPRLDVNKVYAEHGQEKAQEFIQAARASTQKELDRRAADFTREHDPIFISGYASDRGKNKSHNDVDEYVAEAFSWRRNQTGAISPHAQNMVDLLESSIVKVPLIQAKGADQDQSKVTSAIPPSKPKAKALTGAAKTEALKAELAKMKAEAAKAKADYLAAQARIDEMAGKVEAYQAEIDRINGGGM